MKDTYYKFKVGSSVTLRYRVGKHDPMPGILGRIIGIDRHGYLDVKWEDQRYYSRRYLPCEVIPVE